MHRSSTMLLLLSLTLVLMTYVHCADILLLPCLAPSHVGDLTAATSSIQRRGHHVYVALADTYKQRWNLPNGITVLEYHLPQDQVMFVSEEFSRGIVSDYFSAAGTPDHDWHSQIILDNCGHMLRDQTFIAAVKAVGFELMIVDSMPLSMCRVVLPALLKVPFIMMGSLESEWIERVPALPSFVPSVLLPFSDQMSFMERLVNLQLFYLMSNLAVPGRSSRVLLEEYGLQYSHMDDIVKQAALFIVTRNHILEFPSPSLPHVIHVPALTMRPGQPLPDALQTMADTAKHGVVVMAFGSLVDHMPEDVMRPFLRAFEQLPYRFIVRYPQAIDCGKNTHLMKHIPQQDLLAHPNTKLFITHCGSNSVHESLYHNVPMIGFPFFAEQPHNCHQMSAHRFGDVMELKSFTVEELKGRIESVMENDVIVESVARISAIMKDLQEEPVDTVAYWVDHVIKHGSDHLRSRAITMPWYEYMMLDILLFITAITSVVAISVCCCCKLIVGRLLK